VATSPKTTQFTAAVATPVVKSLLQVYQRLFIELGYFGGEIPSPEDKDTT